MFNAYSRHKRTGYRTEANSLATGYKLVRNIVEMEARVNINILEMCP